MNAEPQTWQALIGGTWVTRPTTIEVRNPLDHELVGTVPSCTTEDVGAAVARAASALESDWPAHARSDVLRRAADRIDSGQEAYAWTIAAEGSKTIREARREAPRAATILRLSADASTRISGETLPFDSRPGSEDRVGYFTRVPAGIVGAIAPFNDPLAVAAHKLGPALAAGNAVVLKPASATPLSALRLARDLMESGLPHGRLSVVTGSGPVIGEALASHPEVRVLSFTGGVETGERLTRIAGLKRLSMELGSNSPVIVLPDANLAAAAAAIAAGAFAQAGQNCLGVQRVIVHESVYDTVTATLVAETSRLNVGASLDEATDVCAMIDEIQAGRVEAWVRESIAAGARLLAGGRRDGALVWPAVLDRVPDGVRLDCDEVYGPVVALYSVDSLEAAIERANRTRYGLHAAIFTENLRAAFAAARRLRVGAVIVNDSTDYRLDAMPFGGVKASGIGREGIRHAVEEMTETRVVCLNL